jgi:hypothetical protein
MNVISVVKKTEQVCMYACMFWCMYYDVCLYTQVCVIDVVINRLNMYVCMYACMMYVRVCV